MKSTGSKILTLITAALILSGCETLQVGEDALRTLQADKALNLETIISGLKEALMKGTEGAVTQLSSQGGYYDDKLLHISVPNELEKVSSMMKKIGLGSLVDTFEKKMNTGAEQAAAQAKPVFWNAIRAMNFQDAKGILNGGETAATDYFRSTIGEELRHVFAPIVAKQLNSVGAVRAYNDLMTRYSAIPLVKKPSFDLQEYTTEKTLDGLFSVVAHEEKQIREDPAKRTTELLRRVFGDQ